MVSSLVSFGSHQKFHCNLKHWHLVETLIQGNGLLRSEILARKKTVLIQVLAENSVASQASNFRLQSLPSAVKHLTTALCFHDKRSHCQLLCKRIDGRSSMSAIIFDCLMNFEAKRWATTGIFCAFPFLSRKLLNRTKRISLEKALFRHHIF